MIVYTFAAQNQKTEATMVNQKPISVRLSVDLYEVLEFLCMNTTRKKNRIINDAVFWYLRDHEHIDDIREFLKTNRVGY